MSADCTGKQTGFSNTDVHASNRMKESTDLKSEYIRVGVDDGLAATRVVEDQGMWRDEECVVLCPGCGSVVEWFEDGFPEFLGRFQHECHACEVDDLNRWNTVVVMESVLPLDDREERLREFLTRCWDKLIWSGWTRMQGEFYRNAEGHYLLPKWARGFGWDWEVRCPVDCVEMTSERLEFNHVHYGTNSGLCMTKEAHEFAHGHGSQTSNEQNGPADHQDVKATELGFGSWLGLYYPRIMRRHRKKLAEEHGDDELSRRAVEHGGEYRYLADRLAIYSHKDWSLDRRAEVAEQLEAEYEAALEEADEGDLDVYGLL